MGILDFNTPSTQTQPASTRRMPFGNMTSPNERPKAKLWINLGYMQNDRFVNLPIGTPVDTMEPAEVRGQNADWVKFQSARNDLLKALQELGANIEPGQEVDLNLIVKLRRVNDELAVPTGENEYKTDLSALFAGAKPAPVKEIA